MSNLHSFCICLGAADHAASAQTSSEQPAARTERMVPSWPYTFFTYASSLLNFSFGTVGSPSTTAHFAVAIQKTPDFGV